MDGDRIFSLSVDKRDDPHLGNSPLARAIALVNDHVARADLTGEGMSGSAGIATGQLDKRLRQDLPNSAPRWPDISQFEIAQKARIRLLETMRNLVKPVQRSKLGERHEAHKKLWRSAKMLAISGPGIDTRGHPVSMSIRDFGGRWSVSSTGDFGRPAGISNHYMSGLIVDAAALPIVVFGRHIARSAHECSAITSPIPSLISRIHGELACRLSVDYGRRTLALSGSVQWMRRVPDRANDVWQVP